MIGVVFGFFLCVFYIKLVKVWIGVGSILVLWIFYIDLWNGYFFNGRCVFLFYRVIII